MAYNHMKILQEDEVEVDYYNDGKPMIRVPIFRDYHFRDEYFCDIPVPTAELTYPCLGRYKDYGKCGKCRQTFKSRISETKEFYFCPFCGSKFKKNPGRKNEFDGK